MSQRRQDPPAVMTEMTTHKGYRDARKVVHDELFPAANTAEGSSALNKGLEAAAQAL